jgi:hypothetical protein
MSKTKLEVDLQKALTAELGGEGVRWHAQPNSGRAFRSALWIYLFAVPWTVFAIFWESMAAGTLWALLTGGVAPKGMGLGMSMVFTLFGLPFVAIGLAMLGVPFYARREAAQSVVALTDKRLALITASRGKKTIKSIYPHQVVAIEVTERRGGNGSLKLIFGEGRDSDGDKVEKSITVEVPEVKTLEKHLQAMRERR